MSMIVPKNAVCPYCGNALYEVQIPFGLTEQECGTARCREGWHEGEFRVLCFTVVSRDKRGLGKNRGVMWNIRYKTNGDEGAIGFQTSRRDILLKRKDILLLSFKKRSKGIFRKRWTGEWDRSPSKLFNINIDAVWNV
jgi:hypothetical protein